MDPPTSRLRDRLGPFGVCAAVALAVGLPGEGAGETSPARATPVAQDTATGEGPAPVFSHRLHVEDEGLDCTMCHQGAEEEERAGMPVLSLCRLCHDEPEAGEPEPPGDFAAAFFDSEGESSTEVFSTLPPDIVFSHLRHVEAGVDCAGCHGDMSVSTAVDGSVAPTMGDCTSCHVEAGQPSDCTTCHVDGGGALYGLHCAACHGAAGRGDGPAASLLSPAPRDFGSGRFRLVSTRNGAPTLADLATTIRGGMPGSAMPPAEWLTDEERLDLARYVRRLALEGLADDLLAWAAEQEEELSETEAREIALARMTPGEAIEVVAPSPPGPETLREGRRLFLAFCAACHGEDGTGSGAVSRAGELFNEDGAPTAARDFTAGIFKGGSTHADLVRRLVAGLPGSPMPGLADVEAEEISALVAYVQSLVEPGSPERVRQERRTIPVARTTGALPSDPQDPAWASAAEVWIALTPLWWRDDRIEGVALRGLHDGELLALRLSWLDATRDADSSGEGTFDDAVALQVSVERDPPLFASGAIGRPAEAAFWRATAGVEANVDASLGIAELVEHRGGTQDPPTHGFEVRGLESAAERWEARGAWNAGTWDVVFTRAIDAGPDGEPGLSLASSALVNFAVWDGASGDRGARKSISVWHLLQLAP